MFDGVSVVGARATHELAKVVKQAMLGLLAHAVSYDDQCGVGQSALILFILFAPLRGGALVLVLMLGLALVPTTVEDCSDRLLARGVVRGDIEQVAGGSELQTAKLVDQRLTGCPRDECADDVRIDDIEKGVASF